MISWRLSDLEQRYAVETADAGSSYGIAYSPNGQWLVSGGADKRAIVIDTANPQDVKILGRDADSQNEAVGHTDAVLAVEVSDYGLVATGGDDQKLLLWDAACGCGLAHSHPTQIGVTSGGRLVFYSPCCGWAPPRADRHGRPSSTAATRRPP